jgi:predicted AlkP superfamily phosphohydrolase/phosphomutase
MTAWTTGGIDWKQTAAFALRSDLQGYIRINLKGRESLGIVSPGTAYRELLSRIAEGLQSFRDVKSNEPFIEGVSAIDHIYGSGPRIDLLPDLIVSWKGTPAHEHKEVESRSLGRVRRMTPGKVPNGRSGNHRPEGFFVARGEGIPGNVYLRDVPDILDLAPTARCILGVDPSPRLVGRPIPALTMS